MKRSELFKLVWAEPVSKLAAGFGMSDRGLAKLCTRYHIPLPERGYWAKVRGGQYPARMPLPRPDDDREIPINDSVGSDDSDLDHSDDLPTLTGMDSPNEQNQDQVSAIDQQGQSESVQENLTQLAKPKVKRGAGRPRKQMDMPTAAPIDLRRG